MLTYRFQKIKIKPWLKAKKNLKSLKFNFEKENQKYLCIGRIINFHSEDLKVLQNILTLLGLVKRFVWADPFLWLDFTKVVLFASEHRTQFRNSFHTG